MKTTKTDYQWERWGRQNPYFGVLGVETIDVEADEVREKFFKSGRDHIHSVMKTLERMFGGPQENCVALDFGCGVGRLLLPLAERFESVHAVDVSPSMLDHARKNSSEKSNVIFHNHLDSVQGKVDLVHSYIVFQHIRPQQGMLIIRQLLSILAPGGVLALHVTTGDSRLGRAVANRLRYRIPPLHWAYNIVRGRPFSEPITEMNTYIPFEILELLKKNGIDGAYVQSIDHNGHRGMIFFAKKTS